MIDQFNPFGAEKYKMEIVPDTPASKLYDQGLEKLANGSPQDAAKKFTDLGKQYPSSDWARKGLLMTIYADYRGRRLRWRGNVGRSLSEGISRTRRRPTMSCICRRIPTMSRSPTSRAIRTTPSRRLAAFQAVVQKYPKSEYVEDSKFKIKVTEDQLAGKEMSIGRFYLNRRNYTAAINRFRNVLQYFQTTRHAQEALYRLVEAYLGLGITAEAQTAAAVLGHNFPDSQWYQDAYALLKGKGLSPQEDSKSWISKIYHAVVPS